MKEIEDRLALNYGFGPGFSFKKIEAGFLSENYKVEVDGGQYFLKCYRFNKREKIEEVHRIKRFFASKGIPVILPLNTKQGSTFFSVDEKYFAVLPFVTGIHHDRGSMPPHVIGVLADLAARLHKAGAECDFSTMEIFGDKQASPFLADARQLIETIHVIKDKSAFDLLALESLELKVKLVERDSRLVTQLSQEKMILLHGDFHEQNVFFDESDNVKWVFDFEKAVTGYRGFELWRSADYMFLNGDFSDKRIDDATLYFREYNKRNPISADELSIGLEMYYQRLIHSLWIEREHYIKKNTRTDHFLENRGIKYFAENREAFKKRIITALYQ